MRLRLLLPLLLLAGCRVPGGRHVTEPDVVVPETWSAGRGAEVSEAPWWNQFGDEHLTAMVEEALVHNYDLRASVARIEAAAAQARIAGASLSPTVGLGGRAGRNQQVFVGLPIPGGGGPLSSRSTSYGVSIDVSWEADLWGRLRSARHAAVQDLVASTEDHHAALLSLAAQTSKGWFAWQQALLQEALAESTAASFAHTAELVRRRYENGRDSMLDVHRAEADWASARARVEERHIAVERAGRQLEILLGRHPAGELVRAPYLPEVPALPAAGVPSELVQRRPDLRSAEARLCGADDRAYEARALLYPRLTLSGSGGRTSSELNDLLDADFDVWSLLAGIAQPLFQGGKMRAGVELAEARAREAAANFGAAVLRAFVEVETHLAVEGALERREVEQARATASAKSARDLAAERYAAGRDELTTLLDAQRRALASESELLAVRFLRLESRVDLYLALGGGLATAPESTEESE